jgi:hypothetical protein
MKAISTHSIEQIKVHLVCEEARARLLTSLRSVVKQVSESTEKIVEAAVILLVAALIIYACMTLGESGAVVAYYCDVCDVIPTMFVAP